MVKILDFRPPETDVGSSWSWDEPDTSIIEDTRGTLPSFPTDIIPAWSGWLQGAAAGAGTTPDHIAVPLLSISSSLIGTARRVRASSSWSQPHNIWSAII